MTNERRIEDLLQWMGLTTRQSFAVSRRLAKWRFRQIASSLCISRQGAHALWKSGMSKALAWQDSEGWW